MAVKIGLVGTGTVGGGCIDIIQKHKDDFLRHFGVDIELARVCSLSPAEAEAHGVGHLFTDNFNNIINDPRSISWWSSSVAPPSPARSC